MPVHPSGCTAAPSLLCALFFVACASPEPPPPPQATEAIGYEKGEPGGVIVDTVELNARVVAVDRAERTATLLGPDGAQRTVRVGPEAVNFDQVEVGDVVTATLTRELVISLGDPNDPQADGEAAGVALAPVGARPGGIVAGTLRVTGTVTGIDPVKRTATLTFADGSSRTFPVRPDIDLSRRKLGERVVFQVTESIALDVRKD